MRVLFLSYTSLLQKIYQQRVVELSGKVSDLRVLTPAYWKEIWKDKRVYLEGKLLAGKHFTSGVLFPGNLHLAVFTGKLGGLIKRFSPDIIDMENEPFNLGSLQVLIYRRLFSPGSKVVLHASQNIFKRYPFPFNLIEKYALKKADMVLARTEAAADILRRKGRRQGIRLVPHGVDTGHFRRKQVPGVSLRELEDKVVVGYAGALTRQKGVDILIRAVNLAGPGVGLIIIGEGPEKRRLQELAGSLNISERTVFTDAVPHLLMPDYLSLMDIFVLPSVTFKGLKEKFGRVLLEAMSCGAAVIGSSSGGIPGVIGEGGWVFSELCVPELAEKIRTLASDPGLRSRLGEKGRERVLREFSWEAVAEKTYAAYEDMIK